MPIFIAIFIIALIAFGANMLWNNPKNSAGTTLNPSSSQAFKEYKDGTYTESGTYTSPAGVENVTVTMNINGGIVTEAVFKGGATNPGSVFNQGKFSEGFESLVVGKPINDISLTVVNGSSLTPIGFMDALNKIKASASASQS